MCMSKARAAGNFVYQVSMNPVIERKGRKKRNGNKGREEERECNK